MELLHTVHVPAGDGPFPTVFALHGWGAGGHDLLGLAPNLPAGWMMICPEGQVEVPIGPGAVGHGWFPLVPGQPPDARAFRRASTSLRAFVESARLNYPVDPRRAVVLGFSQGGLMAYDLALRDPQSWAGVVALSTWLPELLASNLPRLEAQKSLPVLVLHGTEDQMVGIDKGRQSRSVLEEIGVDLTYQEFPMAHEIRPEALRTVLDWLGRRV